MNNDLLTLMQNFDAASAKAITRALYRGGIFTIEDLKNATEEELHKIRWIGPKKLKIILMVKESITKER